MVASLEVDNTKAIALPIFFIVALILAMFITRKTLSNAFPRAKSELRLGILYFGGIICTILSVFLFPTAAWQYGIVSALFAYMFALSCAPGIIEKRAHQMFLSTSAWFAVLLGIPSKWSSGIVPSISGCSKWFPVKTAMCTEAWISFAIFIAIAEIIIFFFMMLVLMSFAFDQAVSNAKNQDVNNSNSNRGGGAAAAVVEYQQPLNSGDSSNNNGQTSARGGGGGNINIYSAGSRQD